MTLQKYVMDKLFKGMNSTSYQVNFWDGSSSHYGADRPTFILHFREKPNLLTWMRSPVVSFGEAYMNGAVDIDGSIEAVIQLANHHRDLVWKKGARPTKQKNSASKSKQNVAHHYDIGNDFYKLWLDESMSYSCAYFQTADDTLEQAQLQKIDHVLKKLQLKENETLLDIGSGWGSLIIRAATVYGVKAKGITLSAEQYQKTIERIREQHLEQQVEVELVDYRTLAKRGETFDKIASVGMFEHVGQQNHREFMATIEAVTKDKGLILLHTITQPFEIPNDPWIEKYIFPGGYIPSLREVVTLLPEYNFHVLDIENLRTHYARTLDHWSARFERSLPTIKSMFDERFIRMWRLYLQASAASFRTGNIHIHQMLFSKGINNDLALTRQHIYS